MSLTSSPDIVLPRAAQGGRRFRFNKEAALMFLAMALLWQAASYFYPPYLFPPLGQIARATVTVLTDAHSLLTIGLTYLRILCALAVSFCVALVLAVWGAFQPRLTRALLPLAQFLQGVPALCWVIFAVLWFKNLEARIGFVIWVSAFPSFYYQIREGVRAVPPELDQMVRALRPTRWQTVRKLILPSIVPQILTAWQLNLGAATKVTILAELLGGISGIGYQLRLAQELFRMDQAIAWTAVLIAFVFATNALVALADRRLLRWRESA